ncbi:MAG: extracellular solute-binding protein [Ignavibacteriales bacterium]|nr:extracellular solute-binding protein [Ignavibacteriales bacterium]
MSFKEKIKKYFRGSSFLLAALLLGLATIIIIYFSPFHSSTGSKKTVKEIYFAINMSYANQYVIEKFNEKNKGRIHIIPVDLAFGIFQTNERKELLARSLRSKSDRMDIFEVDNIWVSRFAKWCAPLSNFISIEEQNKILPEALASCFYNQELVALPLYLDIGMMYYRKDILEKLPDYDLLKEKLKNSVTWEEFIDLSRRLKKTEKPFYVFPADAYEGLVCSFIELILSQNPNYFDTHKFSLDTHEATNALQLLVDLVYKYKISPLSVTDFDENTSYKYFINNDGVFLRGWPSYEKDYKNLFKSTYKDTLLEAASLPHLAGLKPTAIIGGWNLMISKYAEKKPEVIEFIKYLISEEAQKILYEKGAYLPILKNLYTNQNYLKKFPDLVFKNKLIQTGVRRPYSTDYTRISDIISYYTNKAIKGEITVTKALKDATAWINSDKILLK